VPKTIIHLLWGLLALLVLPTLVIGFSLGAAFKIESTALALLLGLYAWCPLLLLTILPEKPASNRFVRSVMMIAGIR
jgi:hypothetical protein